MRKKGKGLPFVKVIIEGKAYDVKKLIDYYDKGGKYEVTDRSSKYIRRKGKIKTYLRLSKKSHLRNQPQNKTYEHRKKQRTRINAEDLMRQPY